MEKHSCVVIKNQFSNSYFCHICGQKFSRHSEIQKEVYSELIGLIMRDSFPLTSSEAIVILLEERLNRLN